jgi:hypothetical protein
VLSCDLEAHRGRSGAPTRSRISEGLLSFGINWEKCSDSGNVLVVLDPQKVVTIAGGLREINQVMMTRIGLRSNIEFGATNLVN